MTKTTAAQKLIEAAKQNGGTLQFTIGAGTGNTLHTLKAIRRAGHKAEHVSGQWQTPQGMQYQLTI